MEEVKLDKRVLKQIEATRKLQEEMAARNQILLDSNDVEDEEDSRTSGEPVVEDVHEEVLPAGKVERARPVRKKAARVSGKVPVDPDAGLTRISLYLPADVKVELRIKTYRMGVSMSSYIFDLIRKDLARGKN